MCSCALIHNKCHYYKCVTVHVFGLIRSSPVTICSLMIFELSVTAYWVILRENLTLSITHDLRARERSLLRMTATASFMLPPECTCSALTTGKLHQCHVSSPYTIIIKHVLRLTKLSCSCSTPYLKACLKDGYIEFARLEYHADAIHSAIVSLAG